MRAYINEKYDPEQMTIKEKLLLTIPSLDVRETFALTIMVSPSNINEFMGVMNPQQLTLVLLIKSARQTKFIDWGYDHCRMNMDNQTMSPDV